MDEARLLELKQAVAPGVLSIPGVSGVGVGAGSLNVYLEHDDKMIRGLVERTIRAVDADVPIQFVATGPFRAQFTREPGQQSHE